jgi:hypothetical protein
MKQTDGIYRTIQTITGTCQMKMGSTVHSSHRYIYSALRFRYNGGYFSVQFGDSFRGKVIYIG